MANTSKGRFPSYGLVRGPSHSQGGVPASVANGPDGELEGGEYIIPKEAVPDYLPVLQQITQVGRDRQQMQNGNTAIDALIASASMQNGIAQPKSPVYQEGGRISNFFKKQKENFQRAAMMGEKTGTRNPFLKTAEEQLALQARDTSPLSMRRESPNISLGELEEVALAQPYRPEVMSAREQVNMLPDEALEEIQMSQDTFEPFGRIPNMPEDERGNFLNYLFGGRDNLITTRSLLEDILGLRTSKEQGGMVQYEDGGELDIRRSPMPIQSPKMLGEDSIDSILSIINQGKRNGVNVADTPEYKRYNKSYNLLTKNTKKGVPPAEGEIDRVTNNYLVDISTKAYLMNELIKSGQYDNINQIKDDFINLDLKDTMPQMEEGGEVHSRRMYNQGTGFNKKKSDLDGDGKISEYERKRGMAIAKAMGKMQEGGMVADRTRVSQTYYPTESLNLPMANLASTMNVGSVSQAPMSNQDIAQIVMDIATPGSVIGSIGKKAAKVNPFSMKAKASKIANRRDASGRLYRDPIGGLSKKGMLKLVDEAVPENTMDAYGESLDYFKDMDADDLADVVRGAYGLARNPKFYGEERIGQGAFDLGREGVKMALDDIKNLNIKQQGGPINNYQMGGMVNRQPMMQRPMNPAMNFSPMQRMNPRMYQEGGQVQPRKQFELRNPETFIGPPDSLIGRVYMNPFTGEFEDADAQDKRIEEQIKRLRQRMKQSEIPSSKERVPMQEGGQVNVNSLMGKTVRAKDLGLKNLGEVTSIPPQFQMSRPEFEAILNYGNKSDGEEISQEEQMANFMSLLENEKRVRPVSPDKYIVKDGVMSEVEMNVPKLTSAYMSSFGIATPLSRRQGQMLQRKMIAPETLNPQVKGLLNRILVQRLAAEEN